MTTKGAAAHSTAGDAARAGEVMLRVEALAKVYPAVAGAAAGQTGGEVVLFRGLSFAVKAGEQQRVSLARALVTGPKLLLADEPTGDLDGKTGEAVFSLIQNLHSKHPLTSVLVTHNLEFAQRCGRVLRLRGGRLEEFAGAATS